LRPFRPGEVVGSRRARSESPSFRRA
jgi:hypothetical protein